MTYLVVLTIPVVVVTIGMIYANVRGAHYHPEYRNIR